MFGRIKSLMQRGIQNKSKGCMQSGSRRMNVKSNSQLIVHIAKKYVTKIYMFSLKIWGGGGLSHLITFFYHSETNKSSGSHFSKSDNFDSS